VIAVVCAVPAERRALAGLADERLRVHVSGIGAANAARTAAELTAEAPEALISAGFCGALAADLRVGDLVAADEVVDEATGERFPADPALLAAAPGRRGARRARAAGARGSRAGGGRSARVPPRGSGARRRS
jgi:uridine phosphorylase